jgi:hypothetical protein
VVEEIAYSAAWVVDGASVVVILPLKTVGLLVGRFRAYVHQSYDREVLRGYRGTRCQNSVVRVGEQGRWVLEIDSGVGKQLLR